ncbi:hypothetical protein IT570_01350 [Candidatus Sumerlaeota bacterium]|nr:hypothetical protein [Candidatus Sumerlaeota bacterium]
MIFDRLLDLERHPLGRNRDGAEYDLGHFHRFLAEIGNPERGQHFIHIAGTKGKGSTAAILEGLLRGLGFPVAMFTSPHLTHYGERFRFDGRPLSREEFEQRFDHFVASLPAKHRDEIERAESYRTVFELLTAFALVGFGARGRKLHAENPGALPQIVIWETGLGGRLDCTNVVDPLVSVITTLGMDHESILGDTIEKITREKAGIIKPGRPVVLARQAAEFESRVIPVIAEEAEQNGTRLIKAWEENEVVKTIEITTGQWIHMYDGAEKEADGFLPLHGRFQLTNVETAVTVAMMVATQFDKQPPCKKLLTGLNLVHWPGRFEVLRRGAKTLVIDGAHCPLSADVLGEEVGRLDLRKVVLLWGMQKEKNHTGFLTNFENALGNTSLEKVFCYPLPPPRGADAATLSLAAQELHMDAEEFDTAESAFQAAMKSGAAVVAAGTLYSIAEIKGLWEGGHG